MRVFYFTVLLILGLIASQAVPLWRGPLPEWLDHVRQFATLSLLAYIMIGVGREFSLDQTQKKQWIVDYGVAATAATFPWIFCSVYFVYFLASGSSAAGGSVWAEALLAGRFAAPTSAGVLFSMLVAAGLGGTWVYRKTRILAIFDDLDTVLLMIPLKIVVIGFAWQLGGVVLVVGLLLVLGWRFFRRLGWPTSWPYILGYSIFITAVCEALYLFTVDAQGQVGLQIEVLLPAFILGCALSAEDELRESGFDERVGVVISGVFLFLVGFSMPLGIGRHAEVQIGMSIGELTWHVIVVTLLANLGKMFPIFFYRKEASLKERLAVCVAMFPRGEVGAGVLAVSLSYGVKGPFVTVAFLSLALNLILTGLFVYAVKRLLAHAEER